MPTTSNFGWTTPADTDLVKDGAAAIRTLGNGIDTSFLDLKGGTTGQVLAKASNTDLDFTWSAADPLSILDAKGDLISATAADTPARLAVGANGTYLQADSTEATGLKWAAVSVGGMTLLSTTTLSGASGSITGISGDYTDLRIYVINTTTSTDQNYISFRFNNDSTANRHAVRSYNATNTSALLFDSTSFEISGPADTTTSQTLVRIDIPLYARTDVWKWADVSYLGTDGATTTNYYYARRMAAYNQTSAISSIGWVTTAGNAGGTVLIYGVK